MSIRERLDRFGRLPPVTLEVFPLDGAPPFSLKSFTSYSFNSNLLVPVDTFSFTFKPPLTKSKQANRLDTYIQEGDTVQLTVDGEAISTGFVDEVELTFNYGEAPLVSIAGRDLMGFLEDNDAVNLDSKILYLENVTIDDIMPVLLKDTRIRGFRTQGVTTKPRGLLATNPGESKLAVLDRFCEPLNLISWLDGSGKIVVGQPSFSGASLGVLGIHSLVGSEDVRGRRSNVMAATVRRAATRIPNAGLAIWAGLESVQASVSPRSILYNNAKGPSRLFKAGHKVLRASVVSRPEGNDTKDGITQINQLIAEGNNFLDSHMTRMFARENINELLVNMTVPGHLNGNGNPYEIDQVYDVVVDQAGVEKKMYLYNVTYTLQEDGGQFTTLDFCNLNTIVANTTAVDNDTAAT